MKNKKILEVKDLHVSFKTANKTIVEIIRGINLSVMEAQIVGIVGESGSGKSVATKSILNLNSGSITRAEKAVVSGIDLVQTKSKSDWREVRGKKVAYIPQDPMTSLNPTRTIKKQLLDTLLENRKDIKTNEERINTIVETLEIFGIRDARSKLNSYPHTFSGGMKQRIVIASAVMCQPDLIIADEPTTALDTVVQASVLNLFEKIRKDYKVSIIFISHDISVIAKLCDYIYVMYAGRVVEKGLKKEIFTDPRHPYTWALLSAIPENAVGKLYAIPGTPPNMEFLPSGDPFAPRNDYAMDIDFVKEPPLLKVTSTHYAATWLLHKGAPKFELPKGIKNKIKLFRKVF